MNDQRFWKNRVKEGAALNPIDRISEVLFGLIMVLTFTGTISVATDGREAIRELLWAALGCNLAWGLVDAIMYLMNVLLERGHNLMVLNRILKAGDRGDAKEILKEELQPLVTGLLNDDELTSLADRLRRLSQPSKRNLISGMDILAGIQIFFLVFLCTLPVALPFAFLDDVPTAMRTSNAVALFLLFTGGFILAGYAGFRRVVTASVYVVIGVLLVALTMALGG